MQELVLRVAERLVEPVSDALADELGALAVSVEDADAAGGAEQALFGEPDLPPQRAAWQRSTVRALFTDDVAATEAATLLLAQDWAVDVHVQAQQPVPDEDWVRVTQSQFTPVEITPTFWVVPSWHAAPAAATHVIRLDPGLAFGTGTHPTTRMCLRWIARHARSWPRVLDYGCGSGILAVGSALFGARAIDAVDIDAAAVLATQANAASNDVTVRAGAPDLARGHYDLVLANILAKPLTLLAPLLASRLAPSASLVLAGILQRQADGLHRAYAPFCALEVSDQEEGWILMTGIAGGAS
ncbi:MAG: 50S ribosomal protein L11 methyltransferase [Aquincola sp.]|nr:50S ribosomal protein L11 methyltransferase [Aquincola sp.]MDH4288316.1 50S ribosomal protein L11 methyltransferase [Aquincola sp.]MDH5328654.1 50S ribosomal protein L11 methyltransferase [Aquincola sp.]